MNTRKIYNCQGVSPCYFRTTTSYPYRKAILQITERCNLHCKHCFVSSINCGKTMDLSVIENQILPRLLKLNVIKVTLTGGEPFIHPKLLEICLLLAQNDIEITICTNATLISRERLMKFTDIPKLKFNISLDGFSFNSHGRFRGMEKEGDFEKLLLNIRNIGIVGKLNGLLCTPNVFCEEKEFEEICEFGKNNKAKYVLFNPLSNMGRGQQSMELTVDNSVYDIIKERTRHYIDDSFEVLYIRFPNNQHLPLPQCVLGNMFYVFADGNTTLCPYMVFACNNDSSPYPKNQFIFGNIITEELDIDAYLYNSKLNSPVIKTKCDNRKCFGGCHAAKIMKGGKIDECDSDLCPIR